MVTVSAPYVAGFLAFREAPFLVEAAQRLQEREPGLRPQVLLIDGNGMLHHRGFGVACHLGVLTDLPCIGVAKNLLQVDGLAKDELHKEQIRDLQTGGDVFPLMGTSGRVLGMALRSCNKSKKPIYVSVGHRTCLESAVRLVLSCCRYRIPEPIRQLAPTKLVPAGSGSCWQVSLGRGGGVASARQEAAERLTYDPESTSGSTCPPHRGMWLLSQGGRKRLSLSANLAPGRSCPEQT
ncbi:endonuclease V isoform X5 [Carettochelys insculpta]